MSFHAALSFLRFDGGKSDSRVCPNVVAISVSNPSERIAPFTTWQTVGTVQPYAVAKSLRPYPASQIISEMGLLFFVPRMTNLLGFIVMDYIS